PRASTASASGSTETCSVSLCGKSACLFPRPSTRYENLMEEKLTETIEKAKKQTARPTVSTVLPDGSLAEMVRQENRTLFCVSKDGAFRYETNLLVNGQRLVPYSPRNNLLTNEVVLFPSEPLEYDSEVKLVEDIRAFIHRYVDI